MLKTRLFQQCSDFVRDNNRYSNYLLIHPITFVQLFEEMFEQQRFGLSLQQPKIDTPYGKLTIIRSHDIMSSVLLLTSDLKQ